MNYNFLYLIFFVALTSCASTVQYTKNSTAAVNKDKSAKIYILRPSMFGLSVKMKIFQDEKLIGKLGTKSYLQWEVDADKGSIKITSKAENKSTLTLRPEAGKIYYIKQNVKMGILMARTKLELIDEAEAQEYLAKLKVPKGEDIEQGE